MNALADNEFSRAWMEAGKALPRPSAILSISAHWENDGTLVTAMEQPKTIYDFYGFPESLYEVKYPAPGSLELARLIQETVQKTQVVKMVLEKLDKWPKAKNFLLNNF
jgi:4,5-DOPA dioxygenase extradiol